MKTTTSDMLVPAYLGKFSCLGPTCPDTCCYGWNVAVEHDSYKRLKNLSDPTLKPLIAQALKRGKGKSGSGDFGLLNVGGADGRCALLSGEGLCQLHARCGEAILPDVCATYPRLTLQLHGHLQQTASPSCPEVVRLLVEDERAMQLGIARVSVRQGQVQKFAGSEVDAEARAFFIRLMADAVTPLWQRLALVLLVAQAIDAELARPLLEGEAGHGSAVMTLLGEWQSLLESGAALSAVELWQRDEDLHLQLLAAMSRLRTRRPLTRRRYCQLVDEAAAGWDLGEPDALAAALADPQLDVVLGRVLHNHALGSNFPLAPQPTLAANAMLLCVQYLSLRFWWAGLLAARGRTLTGPEQAELVANYYREVMHNASYLADCSHSLSETGFTKAEHWLRVLPA